MSLNYKHTPFVCSSIRYERKIELKIKTKLKEKNNLKVCGMCKTDYMPNVVKSSIQT